MVDVETESAALKAGWLRSTFHALAFPRYRLLWFNTVLMMTAVHLAFTAQASVAYDITGNNRAVGFVAFAQGVALLVTTPLAGVAADRFAKRLLIGAELILCFMGAALSVLIFTDNITIIMVAIGGFLFGSAVSFFWPAVTGCMVDAIEHHERANGAALLQVALQLTRATAPFAAGGLIAWDLVGSGGTYLIVTLIFLPTLVTASLIPATAPRAATSGSHLWREMKLGVDYVLSKRPLMQAMTSFIVVILLGFSVLVVLPGFTKDVLGAGDSGFGVMFGLNAVGALIASLFVASLAGSKHLPLLLAASSIAFGVFIAATGLMPSFALALLMMLFAGVTGGGFQTLITAAMLRISEPAYFGRVMSLTSIAWSLTNLLGLLVGVLADVSSERAVLVGIGATLSVASLLLALWSWPRGTRVVASI